MLVTFLTLSALFRINSADYLKDSERAADDDARRGAARAPALNVT
jgi:hypothetical protein